MTWTTAQATALFENMTSALQKLGVFDRVNSHEPENTPGRGLSCSITLESIEADPAGSGLADVSGTVTFAVRLWSSMIQRPLDAIDPNLLGAISAVMNAYSSGFTFGGTARYVDLLAMKATTGYVNHEGKEIRVAEVRVPVIINDLWTEVA